MRSAAEDGRLAYGPALTRQAHTYPVAATPAVGATIGFSRPWVVASLMPLLNRRSRNEFETPKMLEHAIAAPAISGLRYPPAASGRAATLWRTPRRGSP